MVEYGIEKLDFDHDEYSRLGKQYGGEKGETLTSF